MNATQLFEQERADEITAQGQDAELRALSRAWMNAANARKYSYHFTWMGRPIIQYPHDIVALQELLWEVKPDLVIETGIAHGGSAILSASLLELIGHGEVLAIDIDIRAHNRAAIETHPMAKRIRLVQGSSIDPEVVAGVQAAAAGKRVLVILDSNHTHDHVLAELEAYAPLVAVGSYCVVMDTVIEDLPAESFPDRPWARGDNPKTAVRRWLVQHPEFEVDAARDAQLLVSVAPEGYLRRVR
jgi:cephalosporin hydroxylase